MRKRWIFCGYLKENGIMGASQSQSYDLSSESMKSAQDKQDIVPSNNVIDGTLIHVTSAATTKTLSNVQELQRIHPPEDIPLIVESASVENMPMAKTIAPKMCETTAE
ncbi:unnamed protein product [Litomosoides sigmodontis]|uniref:Uncharacterized protein n=1 Tax=Litomosoides sigmodontis TaxID=42156 RepID=A0A3P6SM08_LITSI|nr:unnamed protein product [Litomosoides sigmodontis]